MEAFLVCWFATAAASTAWVVRDLGRTSSGDARSPRIAWALSVLLLGPVGFTVYLATCRAPRPGAREAVSATVPAAAGAAAGILVAAALAAPPAIESAAALVAGGILLRPAATIAIVPLAALVAGMVPTLQMLRGGAGPEALELYGALAAATVAGLVFAHPWSWLLVGNPRAADPDAAALTRREREVTTLAAGGRSNSEIAAQLEISVRTVESHLYHAMVKLGVDRRGDLPDAASVRTPTNPSTGY